MGIIASLLFEDDKYRYDIEALEEDARVRAFESAPDYVMYIDEQLELLNSHEPKAYNVGLRVGSKEKGEWRSVLRISAIVAMEEILEQQVNFDIDAIKNAVKDVEAKGYTIEMLTPSLTYGWCPHIKEQELDYCKLYFWGNNNVEVKNEVMAAIKLTEDTIYAHLNKKEVDND